MKYRVLGALQIEHEGQPVRVTQPKSRALLGLLLAHANHIVPTDQLIEELWLGKPPASAAGALRVHITNLRQSLAQGGADRAIEAIDSGYRIAAAIESVDALVFESALGAAREAADAGSPAEVADILEPALALWRGPAYADLGQFFSIAAAAVRINESRLEAVELLADAHLALDRPRRATELLAPLVDAEPLRESLAERLMLSLYRSGRASEALRVYSRLREALDEELGVTPGPSARALEEAIVLQGPELELANGPRRVVTPDHPRPNVLVGRRGELAALSDLLEQSAESESRLVLIRGAAGIGKSTFAHLGARRAADLGFMVLSGTCEPDPVSDYEPFPRLTRDALADFGADQQQPQLFGELGRLAPDMVDALPPASSTEDVTAGRQRLFAAVNLLLTGRPTPRLIVIEDLHWARPDALALLSHVVRHSEGRLVVIATYRSGPASYPELSAALSEGRLGQPDLTINLDGLDVPELTALVRLVAEEPVRSRLLHDISELRDLTGGNPLFVREVVRTLTEAPGPTPLEGLAPGGIRELAQQRLQRLSPGAREALVVASVLGREFSLHLVAATLRASESETLDALDEALAAQLLDETDQLDRFAFHPLIRNAIYVTTPASRRVRLHLRAAEAIEAEFPSAEPHGWAELARHLVAARPLSDAVRTAAACRSAADGAATRFAHEDAIVWYRHALDLASDANLNDQELGTLLLALGICLEATGQRNEARDIYLEAARHAEEADDQSLLADVAIAATPRYIAPDHFQRPQLALIDQALPGVDSDPRRLAWLLSSASAARYYDDGDGPYAERARQLARSSTDPEVRATGLLTYHRWLTHDPTAAEQRLELIYELRDLCVVENLESLFGRIQRALLTDLMGLGRFNEVDAELEVFAAYAETHRTPGDLYWITAHRAARRLMITAEGETEELIRAARTLGRKLEQADAEGTFILQTFMLRFQQDRSAEVVPSLEAPPANRPRIIAGMSIFAACLAAAGRDKPARQLLDRAVSDGQIVLPHDNLWLGATALFAAAAVRVGSVEQRAAIETALTPFAEHWCVFGAGAAVVGTGHHWLGRLAEANGDGPKAQRHLARARDLARAAGSTYWAR